MHCSAPAAALQCLTDPAGERVKIVIGLVWSSSELDMGGVHSRLHRLHRCDGIEQPGKAVQTDWSHAWTAAR